MGVAHRPTEGTHDLPWPASSSASSLPPSPIVMQVWRRLRLRLQLLLSGLCVLLQYLQCQGLGAFFPFALF